MFGKLDSIFFARHLDDDEEILLIVHKHWLIGLRFVFWPIISFLAAWVFLYVAPFLSVFYFVSLWAVVSLVWFFRNFFDYYLDAWLITSEGIIDVAWHGWFHRESSRVLYSDIQGVSYEIQGVTSTLFRYGQISVEKLSTGNVISMEFVKSPRRIESVILKNMEGYMHTKNLKDAKSVQEILAGVIAREMHLQELNDDTDDAE